MSSTTINRNKLKHRQSHDNTTVSKNNRKLEDELASKLNTIVNIIRKRLKNNERYDTQLYYSEVYNLVRSYYQKSYMLGIDYVTIDIQRLEPYITKSDVTIIENGADLYTRKFFGRIENALHNTFTERDFSKTPLSKYSNNFIVNSLAVAICTEALNKATVQKAKATLPQQGSVLQSRIFQGGIKQIEQRLADRNVGLTETLQAQQPAIQIVFVWTTSMDDQVCVICLSLEGTIYRIDEDIIPDIPDGSHYNCRCRLMLEELNPI